MTKNNVANYPVVIHLVPYDGIGGVETAARSMADFKQDGTNFQVNYIFSALSVSRHRFPLFNPFPYFDVARRIIAARPDILIVSLWRSCAVAFLVKLIFPRIRVVLFLHSTEDVHFPDRLLTRLTAMISHQIWADSKATLVRRLPDCRLTKNGKVISFVIHHIFAPEKRLVEAVFIFWGRIHALKRLERALAIFANIHAVHPEARFIIIGPDGGELARLQKLILSMGLTHAVRFAGEMNFSEIKCLAKDASFYLQTSELEGMAMSVVEGMQLGLVPVVTPVGEISSYCRHQKNSLLITSDRGVAEDILALLNDPQKYEQVRNRAIATWVAKPLYAESVVNACLEIYSEINDEG
ncbi:Glycosyltransferase involved in cell wall bisynthesis [Candidatus Electrothrix aarhusensis]|uniref:Glycosyltransferase involved in cell wall bisynthesis n=1 Tax=Candidatus Electrothrix aarhusensis TaxID=1859131 RepID=A0A3S3SJ51_9BACT|nr:Glycosyltransferase involved in cell wall bisynthesis [Candidatus Electrothrix aarhusensis]